MKWPQWLDKEPKKRVHFMGVGGSGCSSIFSIAHYYGYEVSGCDGADPYQNLEEKLCKFVVKGHSSEHIHETDLLVYSPAIVDLDPNNPELVEAKKRGLATMPWEEFVAREILPTKYVIAVAGTHGKGTVTAMIGAILEKAGLDPTVLIGAKVSSWKKNFRIGKSRYFLIEADEYKERFLNYPADLAVVTNIDFDHPEYFSSLGEVKKAFERFVKNLKQGSLLVTGPGVDLENPNGRTARVLRSESFELKMPGDFNQVNATLASVVSRELVSDENKIRKALESFSGVSRRFEFIGEEKGVLVFDDFAHHPTAILLTAKMIREKFPVSKIWLVFQPHLFTRTKVLFDEFVKAFEESPVDEIVLLDIFAAREKNDSKISSENIAREVKSKRVKYIGDLQDAALHLVKELSVGDIVLTMGAGDISKMPRMILSKLKGRG